MNKKLERWASKEEQTFLMGWMYFLRIPLPLKWHRRLRFNQNSFERSIRYFSIFGILVGAASGGIFWLVQHYLGQTSLAAALAILTSILLTGALHEDGLGDFFDAFGGGYQSRQRILEIMKDSRLGTYGTVAIVMTLLLRWQMLTIIPPGDILWTLIAAHAFSRFAAGAFIFSYPYARANDTESYQKPIMKNGMKVEDFILLAAGGMIPALLLGNLALLLALPVLWLIRAIFGQWFLTKLGGYTGDCLGATQQVMEIAFYLAVIVSLKI